MAVEINGKVYRNLPEQVKKNQEDIEAIISGGIDNAVHKGSAEEPSNEDIYGLKTFKEVSGGQSGIKVDGPNNNTFAKISFTGMQASSGNNDDKVVKYSEYQAGTIANLDTSGMVPALRFIQIPNKNGTLAVISDIPTNVSAFTNDAGYITSATMPTNIENGTATGSLLQKIDANFVFSNPQSSRNGETVASGATGQYSLELGGKSKAEGKRAVAEGTQTIAQGNYSHSEGNNSIAVGSASHVEGLQCVAAGDQSHAEGNNTIASGNCSHTEGEGTRALGYCSIATGLDSFVSAGYASAHGMGSRAVFTGQFIVGKYNQETGDALFAVGSGSADNNRSNALEVWPDGTLKIPNYDGNGNKIGYKRIKCVNGALKVVD